MYKLFVLLAFLCFLRSLEYKTWRKTDRPCAQRVVLTSWSSSQFVNPEFIYKPPIRFEEQLGHLDKQSLNGSSEFCMGCDQT